MLNSCINKIKKKKNIKKIILMLIFIFSVNFFTKNTNQGKQYEDKLNKDFTNIKKINIKNKLVNQKEFLLQLEKIKIFSPNLYSKNISIYNAILKWLKKRAEINELNKFRIKLFQMKGVDQYGNVKITGYYTPIVKASKIKKNNFIYPIYRTPSNFKKNEKLPQRKDIYNGFLKKEYILAYSDSLINNFIMEIQGSGFIDYGDNKPLIFFGYAKKNNWPYTSIGQILIKNGDIQKKNISMNTIKNWCTHHTQKEIQNLLEKNKSFVFFQETKRKEVYGSSAVPLVEKAAIAVDKSVIKIGSVVLVKIPVLDKNGIFIHKYEMHLLIALDVGGVIKGQHFDVYQGIGEKAGKLAGFYNHYGYAWVLKI
ncbi:murein transglycosylase A [Buchnera aphidicola]|jgi:membrane-bound lytic murein transglycosylase A|uniref:Membrane-bound lytic murein transglycosylase A homolog n=1 Tax=Buchnera aphidicola subsp. Schizaphis graminum (strain Sg) TaxID=198804 RepID=MLTA_BUCAP|nr:murein transglycosylase A [Buchnera aphidicola]Q8K9A7.1 RecName: Full=Membrane-bound lytic murein transglycosylase A homolog; AltName: Full=Murein hydrolase A [Buchnera aphidicola str. Sg (Schizaphis graminum)]AAM67985.1 membrane-bound lytic murein transglycosylase [Buchnera aphidicola str. Sg (Schizaphis graminum)]AWI49522.1 murein transglycosylase A [Buchnera aphidicola (Schizaphis graminum)]